jgi:hypothetical protein
VPDPSSDSIKIEFDLLANAQDSIEGAIELIAWGDEQPEPRRLKQSIQTIAHGVELLLKERLKRVHPSLIWENVDKYPNLNARTVTAEAAMSRLTNIGGLKFAAVDIELIRSLRATRNAIEHYAWSTTKQEAEAIVGRALEFTLHFAKSELGHEFFGYHTRKDDTFQKLLGSNQSLAEAMARRIYPPSDQEPIPELCLFCRARAVDPVTHACRLCGHWAVGSDDDIPF